MEFLTWALYVFVIGILATMGFYALRILLFFKQNDKLTRQVHGHITEISKLKGQLKRLSELETNPSHPSLCNMTDLSNLTLEGVAKELGFEKELNNPLIRPIAEKIFSQIKTGAGNEEEKVEGY